MRLGIPWAVPARSASTRATWGKGRLRAASRRPNPDALAHAARPLAVGRCSATGTGPGGLVDAIQSIGLRVVR